MGVNNPVAVIAEIVSGSIDGVTIGATTPVQARAHRPLVSVSATTKTLALTDQDTFQNCSNASTQTITVPTNASVAFPLNTEIDFFQAGAGQVIFAAAGGVTIDTIGLKIQAQYGGATLKQIATDTWALVGNLTS